MKLSTKMITESLVRQSTAAAAGTGYASGVFLSDLHGLMKMGMVKHKEFVIEGSKVDQLVSKFTDQGFGLFSNIDSEHCFLVMSYVSESETDEIVVFILSNHTVLGVREATIVGTDLSINPTLPAEFLGEPRITGISDFSLVETQKKPWQLAITSKWINHSFEIQVHNAHYLTDFPEEVLEYLRNWTRVDGPDAGHFFKFGNMESGVIATLTIHQTYRLVVDPNHSGPLENIGPGTRKVWNISCQFYKKELPFNEEMVAVSARLSARHMALELDRAIFKTSRATDDRINDLVDQYERQLCVLNKRGLRLVSELPAFHVRSTARKLIRALGEFPSEVGSLSNGSLSARLLSSGEDVDGGIMGAVVYDKDVTKHCLIQARCYDLTESFPLVTLSAYLCQKTSGFTPETVRQLLDSLKSYILNEETPSLNTPHPAAASHQTRKSSFKKLFG